MGKRSLAFLTRGSTPAQAVEVQRWWSELAPGTRRALQRDAGRPPAGVIVRFVEPGASEDGAHSVTDFYEHLVNHEVYLDDGRTFHICSAHPAAREALRRGHVPATFRCPRGDARSEQCPMRALVDEARGLDLRFCLAAREANDG